MAPSRRLPQDDSSSSSRAPGTQSTKANGKKAITSNPTGMSSLLREATTADADESATLSSAESKGISWTTESLDTLQAYRFAHRLPNPSPFTHPQNQALLTNPGIGQHSPTAVALKRRRAQQQQKKGVNGVASASSSSRQDLGAAVRRHFKAMAAEESNVIAAMCYKVQNQGELPRSAFLKACG
ncbi:hypothetical protein ANO11243_063790 [Dothideomycetidae sp. 11243]|nr:hypothetical protein ANO11243_063790 [fungal sp. No.11243]